MSSNDPPPYPGTGDEKGNQGYGAPYPPPGGYPPPQGGYGQQGGYGPPQAGYPQPQPSYPPPQGGYPTSQGGYPTSQGGYPASQGYPTSSQGGHGTNTTVYVTQPTMAVVQTFQSAPVRTMCPHCRAEIVTATHFESGTFSWVICVILCLLGCDFGCCLIPFCVEGCQDVIHTCPNCHQHIARWSRM